MLQDVKVTDAKNVKSWFLDLVLLAVGDLFEVPSHLTIVRANTHSACASPPLTSLRLLLTDGRGVSSADRSDAAG